MILFPNAKINLGLYVVQRRQDRFHNLETCFYPIPWNDIIEIIPSQETFFTHSGNSIPGNQYDNLCLKGYHALRKDFAIPPVHIHLHKIIPIGAGLGGGSSDAAFVCKLLNQQFNLGLTDNQLEDYVRPLGSDCAFFIQNKPVLAHQKGDVFSDSGIVSLKDWWISLIHPDIHVSTAEAYQGVVPNADRTSLTDIIRYPVEEWKHLLINDFETNVFKQHPEISSIKKLLYESGAVYASMSGSGSAVFGLFKQEPIVLPALQTYRSIFTARLT